MKPEVYIDGDVLPYKVGFSTQHSIFRLDEVGLHSCSPVFICQGKTKVNRFLKECPDLLLSERLFVESPMQAITTLKNAIQNIVQGSQCEMFKVVISGEGNFREKVATIQKYKGNRENFEKPRNWQLLRDWLADKPYTIIAEGEEADDVISRAMMAGHVGATIDKDLDNTPGLHYNFNKGVRYEVTEEEAMRNFYTQCLTGDTADNIPGIRGIGPAKAGKILSECSDRNEYEEAVLRVYREKYDDPVAALTEVGQLLWMRREEEEMWTPLCVS